MTRPLQVVAEPVVGATTGALPAPKGYFKAMRSVCKKYGALYILDEVMCGMGRNSFSSLASSLEIDKYSHRNGNDACMAELRRRRSTRHSGCCQGPWRRVSARLARWYRQDPINLNIRYASIGAILMSKEVADGVRNGSGL